MISGQARDRCRPERTIATNVIATVRSLRPSDLIDAVALDLQIFGGWWSLQSYQQELQRANSSLLGLWLQADVGNRDTVIGPTSVSLPLIGISCLWRVLDEAHITILGIHPQYQGRGLGQALLVSLLQTAHHHQSARATLEVRAANAAAVALYTKLGFQTAGRRPQYYDNGDDALILWQGRLQSSIFLRSLQHWQFITEERLASWNCAFSLQSCWINLSLQ